MKKIFIFIFSLISLHSVGQVYHPFPKDSATWSVQDYYDSNSITVPDICATYHSGIFGDTIINSKTYSKGFGNNTTETHFNLATAIYSFATREDSSKKVWRRGKNDTADYLLYDFGLQLGDTFMSTQLGCMNANIVTSIDSVWVSGDYRRQIHFSGIETWIEGIGSTTAWFANCWISDWSERLLCCTEKNIQLYGDSYCNCNFGNGISNFHSKSDEIKIEPNPVGENLKISEFENSKMLNAGLTVYDLWGRKCISIINLKSEIVNTSSLPNGIYFLEIKNDKGQRWSKKFIKQ